MRQGDRLYFLGLLGLVLWIFRRPVFEGAVLYKRDIHLVWYPQVETFVRAIAAGSWPVWDPGLAGGQPLLADPNAQIGYPLTWLNLVVQPWTYYTLFAAGHVLLSGVGLYLLARRWAMSRAGAFVAAGLWMLSGPFLSLADLWHHLASAAWIPWVLLTADTVFKTPRIRNGLLFGAATAFQILAGSADMTAMTGLAVAGQALGQHVRWRRLLSVHNRSLAAALVGGVVLAAGLSAVFWLPTLDVAGRSARWSLPAEMRTYWSLHPLSAIETVIPVLWGGLPLKRSLSSAMLEEREPFLGSIYLGAPALVLVGAGLAFSSTAHKAFLAVMGLVAFLVALGRNAPFYGLFVTLLPPLQILRYPVKALTIFALSWGLLAGFGFDAWCNREAPNRRRWLMAAVGPAAMVACIALTAAWMVRYSADLWAPILLDASSAPRPELLARMASRLTLTAALAAVSCLLALGGLKARRRPFTALCLSLLALGDLAALHRNIEPVAPKALFTHRPEVLDALGDVERARVYVYDYSQPGRIFNEQKREAPRVLARAPESWDRESALALAMQMSLTPLTAGRWGLDSGFEIDYRGLFSSDVSQLSQYLTHLEGTPAHLRLLQAGGVTHVVALHQEGFEDLLPTATIPGLYRSPIRVFRVPGTLPRTYVVGGARMADAREAFHALTDPAFDPRREVVLRDGPSRPAPSSSVGISRILERRPDRVRIEADLREEGYVVLLDGYDPGWRVSVDGQASRLLKANVAFRAVRVAAGRHTIEFLYRPRAVILGLALTSLSAVAALVAAGRLFHVS